MGNHLLVGIDNGGLAYQLFYLAAFLVAYAILIYEGWKRRFPLLSWVLILAAIRLAVVIGTKVFAYSPDEWQYMFENHVFLPNAQKTMFGGFLLGVVAWLVVSRLLKFRKPAWDAVAYVIPAAVAIQSLGCFFYGCCFGNPSSMPWAVQYPVMSLAHYHQFEAGLLTLNDNYSLPVHPVQLYESLGAIIVLALVLLFRRRWKADGSLLLSSLIFFALTRFLIEFFRDPLSNKTGGELIWILKGVQWQYLGFALLMTLLLIWRETRHKFRKVAEGGVAPSLSLQIGFLLSIILVILALRTWFTVSEVIALNIAVIPAIYLVGSEIFRTIPSTRLRWVYACTLVLPLFLMSQTIPQTQIDTAGNKTYHTIGGGFATGNYTTERTLTQGSGCNMVTDEHYFHQQYTVGGVGYSYTRVIPERRETITYGANLVAGKFSEANIAYGGRVNSLLIDLAPYIKYDTRWLGLGAGLHVGNLFYNNGDAFNENISTEKAYFRTPIFPGAYLRIGPTRYFYADMHIADHFPASSPGLSFLAGVGTGFGVKSGLSLNVGLSFIDENTWYVSGYIPIDDRLVLEPLFMWTGKSIYPEYPIDLPENQVSIGISYRFGHK